MPDYEIKIPGLKDIYKVEESQFSKIPEKQRERIIRMKQKKSPIPEPLRWIPGVINIIDDAQDLLFSLAYAAKPLLKRVPKKFIPYVGWGLTLLDVANMATFILGFSMNPCLKKPDFVSSTKKTWRGIKEPKTKFEAFVKKGGWRGRLAFVLQSGQAAETVFGKGLQLGTIFGTLSDLFWIGLRKLKGEEVNVKVKWPQKDDPIYKAVRLLTWQPVTVYMHDILSPEDHLMLIAAQRLAIGVVAESGIGLNDSSIEELLDINVPISLPTDPVTLQILKEEGVPVDDNSTGFWPNNNQPLTFGQLIDGAMEEYEWWGKDMRQQPVDFDELSAFYYVHREAGEDFLSAIGAGEPNDYLEPDQFDKTLMKYTEYDEGIHPSESIDTKKRFMDDANYEASVGGRELPQSSDFTRAAKKRNLNHGSRSLMCGKAAGLFCLSIRVANRAGGYGIYNAYVDIIGSGFSTWTNEWGMAHFWGVPLGYYTLEIHHRCFHIYRSPFHVTNPAYAKTTIALDQAPNSRFTPDWKIMEGGAWDYKCEFY